MWCVDGGVDDDVRVCVCLSLAGWLGLLDDAHGQEEVEVHLLLV